MSLETRRDRIRQARKRARAARKAVPKSYGGPRRLLAKTINRFGEIIEALTDQIRDRKGLPNWLPTKYADQWRKPWTVGLSSEATFKSLIWEHGFLSPNFSRRAAASGDGQAIPSSLRGNAQYHAFSLERVRHRLGDRAMNPLSWYRSPAHNAKVGGATASQHLQGNATDWSDSERQRLGSSAFNAAMQSQFAGGGIGTYQGNVRHGDNGAQRRWTY